MFPGKSNNKKKSQEISRETLREPIFGLPRKNLQTFSGHPGALKAWTPQIYLLFLSFWRKEDNKSGKKASRLPRGVRAKCFAAESARRRNLGFFPSFLFSFPTATAKEKRRKGSQDQSYAAVWISYFFISGRLFIFPLRPEEIKIQTAHEP